MMENFLKPLYDITCTFLSRESKTASLYFLGVYNVYRLLILTKGQENFMSAVVEDVKGKFDKYWSEYSLVLACSAVLDPRYKLNLISYCFRKIYDDADASQHIDRVVALLHRLFTEYEKSTCSSSVGMNVVEYHTKDDLFDDYAAPKQISELDWYLESPTLDLNVDLDILGFWSGMSKCYPYLASLARDILAIPISTVACKSTFTVGGSLESSLKSSQSRLT
uniref:HAT C-terminal dimerisation domain-containing protein n=1 Tax=Arundo donax TaxID=35708 RepID=A0A0A9DJC0_ARUDO